MSQKRQPNSLMSRIEAFYSECPDEWLTIGDMEHKFDASAEQIREAIHRLRGYGRMTIVPLMVYRRSEEA